MIAAYAQNGEVREAMLMYQRMSMEGVRPNAITFVSALGACSSPELLRQGKCIHNCVIQAGVKIDEVLATALVSMYGKCGAPREASRVFEELHVRDLPAWNATVSAFALNGHLGEAITAMRKMALDGISPVESTLIAIADACAEFGAFDEGAIVHAMAIAGALEKRAGLGTTIATMYGRCGSLDRASEAFECIAFKDLIAWNAMIAAFAQNRRYRDAILVLHRMDLEGIAIDSVTAVGVVGSYAGLAAAADGRRLHRRIHLSAIDVTPALGTALVDMYGRCGHVDEARAVFDSLSEQDRNVATWTAMMAAFSLAGDLTGAMDCYRAMVLSGVLPSYVTMVSVLAACNHAGMLCDGAAMFFAMGDDHGVEVCEEHWSCIVDSLGRAGRLEDAEMVLCGSPIPLGLEAWMGLLGACRTHGDLERGARVAAMAAARADGEEAMAPLVLLRNMYAAGGENEVGREMAVVMAMVARRRRSGGGGRSFVEVGGKVHEFVGGVEHPEGEAIKIELRRMEVVEAGDEVVHSELMAVGYGLMAAPPGKPLRIVGSLGVCARCHHALKLLSRVQRREIVLRDCEGLHRFDAGVCSCGG